MPLRCSILLVLFAALGLHACVSPDAAPVSEAGEVTRELRAPLQLTWRETVAAIHELGIVVPHDQRHDTHAGRIRTQELRADLTSSPDGESTTARVLFYDRDSLRASVRGESLLDNIEDRLDLHPR